MDERVNMLCRRIELYRNYLRQGADAALAATYLREIVAAENLLTELLRQQSSEPPPPPDC